MPADLTPAEKLRILVEMYRIRHFEDECSLRYCRMDMGGWLILSSGQEGTPVAVRALMGPEDHTISGARGMAPAIASGMPLTSIMAEFFGRATGCSAGKGGQFSLYSPEHRHWGSYATAAAQTPVAAGLAFALKSRGQRGAVFCYLGEGAVNQGVFHETLNLAGLFHLPVVFLIENNGFALGTHTRRGSAFRGHLARRAEGYDIDWARAEGWDIPGVLAAVREARTRAVEDSRPTVLEVQCYRFRGFTISDANTYRYRKREEVEWQKEHRDPIQCWATALRADGLLDETQEAEIIAAAKAEARAASQFAQASPWPQCGDICRHVYWETDHGTPAGRHFFGQH